MANPARALDVLNRLNRMGVTLSIDDFGIGYSSLNYLKSLPIDVLKIDKSFVLNMSASPADEMIVRSTIELARNLSLRVVAEGIESHATYVALKAFGCEVGQGFHLGRPGPPEDVAWAPRGTAQPMSRASFGPDSRRGPRALGALSGPPLP